MALILLYRTCNTVTFPEIFTQADRYQYDPDTKTVLFDQYADDLCFEFSLPTDQVIDTYVQENVERKVYHNGTGGLNFIDTLLTNPITVSATKTDVNCFGGTNGTVDVSVSGGDGNYTYAWNDDPVTTQDRNGLAVGSYTVNVSDGSGNTGSVTVVINGPGAALTATAEVVQNSVSVTVQGGTPGYTYGWSDGGSGASRQGLVPGTYTCVVTDSKGCSTSVQATVTYEPPVFALTDFLVNGTPLPYLFEGFPLYLSRLYTIDNTVRNDLITAEDVGQYATIAEGCAKKQAIYLTWLNRRGGWDSWLFDGLHEYSYQAQNGIPYVTADRVKRWAYRGDVEKRIAVNSGQLTKYLVDVINNIRLSIQVYMYDGEGFNTPVIIDESTYQLYKEGDKEYSIAFTMSVMPYVQVQRQ